MLSIGGFFPVQHNAFADGRLHFSRRIYPTLARGTRLGVVSTSGAVLDASGL